MGFGLLPTAMTPEFGNALIVIDSIALAIVALIFGSGKIAAGSSRMAKLLGYSSLLERFKLWRAAHKSH
jgi:hypothetical protein